MSHKFNKLVLALASMLIVSYASNAAAQAFKEDFDSASVPALPAGWASEAASGGQQWATVDDGTADRPSDTPHTSAFVKSVVNQNASLVSPVIRMPYAGNSELSLRHRAKTESGWDGCALEISVNGGAFADITTQGTFLEGPYAGASLIGGPYFGISKAWTGELNYVLSRVALPVYATGTALQFRVRCVSDASVAQVGCSVDTFKLNGADLTLSTTDSGDPVLPGAPLSYTVKVKNNGAIDAANVILNDIVPPGFNVSSLVLSQGSVITSVPPVIVASIGSLAPGSEATFTMNGTSPAITPSAPVLKVNSPAAFAHDMVAGEAQFGPKLNGTGVSGDLIVANDAVGDVEDACTALPAGFATNKVLLIHQGVCSFNQQVFNAQQAGAVGAVIYMNATDAVSTMGDNGIAVTIPSLQVGYNDGIFLKNFAGKILNVKLALFSTSSTNEVRAFGSQLEDNATDNFSVEYTVVAPDSDGDGIVDPAENCPADPRKTQPGVCGCGVADADANVNGVLDCLTNPELRAQAQTLSKLVGKMKKLPSSASKKQLAAQKKLRSDVKKALSALTAFIQSKSGVINLSIKTVTITKHSSTIKGSINAALKLKATFAKDKKAATKALAALLKAIA